MWARLPGAGKYPECRARNGELAHRAKNALRDVSSSERSSRHRGGVFTATLMRSPVAYLNTLALSAPLT